jgi:type II secretory pathway predicted ATPase ExeA
VNQTRPWLSDAHRQTFEALHDVVVRGGPLAIVTGDVGVGKTMLVEALAARLGAEGVIVGRLSYPSRDPDDFWTGVAAAFQLAGDTQTRQGARLAFARRIRQAAQAGVPVVLVVDEAQALGPEVLDEALAACDIAGEAGASRRFTVLLVGQGELDRLIAAAELATAPADRIAIRRRLRPLTPPEVSSYIQERFACIHGAPRVFTPDAVARIAVLSRGLPRLIDTICGEAIAGPRIVDAALVQRSAHGLGFIGDNTVVPDRRAPLDASTPGHRRRWREIILVALAGPALLALAATMGGRAAAPPPPAPAAATPVVTSAGASRPALSAAVPQAPRPPISDAETLDHRGGGSADTAGDSVDLGAIIDWLLQHGRAGSNRIPTGARVIRQPGPGDRRAAIERVLRDHATIPDPGR